MKDGSSFVGTIHTWFELDDNAYDDIADPNAGFYQNAWFIIEKVLVPSTEYDDFKTRCFPNT